MEEISVDEQQRTIAAIVAEVEAPADAFATQIAEMDRRIAEMEAAIGDLRMVTTNAAPAVQASATGRKTLPTHVAHLLTKQGVTMDASGSTPMDVSAVDAALTSLSVEQRIAVKSQMLRAGLLA